MVARHGTAQCGVAEERGMSLCTGEESAAILSLVYLVRTHDELPPLWWGFGLISLLSPQDLSL